MEIFEASSSCVKIRLKITKPHHQTVQISLEVVYYNRYVVATLV